MSRKSGPSRRTFLKTAIAATTAPFGALGSSGVTVLRYPYVQNVRKTRVTVRWTTVERGPATVVYSRDGLTYRTVPATSREFTKDETADQTYYRHDAVLTGLAPGTDYTYNISMDGQPVQLEDELDFRTAGSSSFDFLVMGDSGMGTSGQTHIATSMQRERPRFLLHTGDLGYPTSTYKTLERRYFDFYRPMMKRLPFFPCLGNHDYYDTDGIPYINVHDLPTDTVREIDQGRYFSFDWANVHVVSLDSNTPLVLADRGQGEMINWFRRDLESSKKFWRVVYFHHPPFAWGPNYDDGLSQLARQRLTPIIDEHSVPVVFNGHEHSYQRSVPIRRGEHAPGNDGAVYVTTGGGGASLYPVHAHPLLAAGQSVHHYLRVQVEGYKMHIHAVDANGAVFDTTTIAPPPLLTPAPVLNSASFTPMAAAGGLISIFGKQLASDDYAYTRVPLPREMNGVKVTWNERDLPLLLVSPTQINAQLPHDVAGPGILRVTNPNGSAECEFEVLELAPALFSNGVAHQDGSAVSEENPASRGEKLFAHATGLGAVTGPPPDGQYSTAPTERPVLIDIDGELYPAELAGLAPGSVGVYRVTFALPQKIGNGQHSIALRVGDAQSNAITFAIA